jgi:hypothetical protein
VGESPTQIGDIESATEFIVEKPLENLGVSQIAVAQRESESLIRDRLILV